MSDKELVDLLARKFIARRNIKARQLSDGQYVTHTTPPLNWIDPETPEYIPWTRPEIEAHISGEATYGHYVLDADDTCKLICFDVDLEQDGFLPQVACPLEYPYCDIEEWTQSLAPGNPRECWLDRAHPSRAWTKYQMRAIAGRLARGARESMDLRVAVAYSGSKGVHVYCFFPERVSGKYARDGAILLLESLGDWELHRGQSTFKHTNKDPFTGFPNFTVEVYPKQVSLEGKHLGNLLRLPLGVNLKARKQPTFFVDLRTPFTELVPCDPIWALTTDDPWR